MSGEPDRSGQGQHTKQRSGKLGHPREVDPTEGDPQRDLVGLGRSPTETTVAEYAKFNFSVFLVVGLGIALALVLLDLLAFGDGALETVVGDLLALGVVVGLLAAPLLAGVTGTITGLGMDDTDSAVGTAAGVGVYAGFLAMVTLLIAVAYLLGGTAGDLGSDLVGEVLAVLGFGLGVVAAGVGAAFLTNRYR